MLLTLARVITAALLIASAAAFVTGAIIEHHTAGSESRPTAQHTAASTPGENPGNGESASGHGDSGQPEAGHEGPVSHAAEQNSESLLGINPEATGLVVAAAALSLLLATLILTVGSPLLAAGVALIMLAFAALDVHEVTHQLHESRTGLAALAATVAVLHLAAGAAALLTTRNTRRQSASVITS